ncbi:MAG: hypothetical protein COZ69_04375 [Deltaproteobacteria bacterium CG_4_8_14_3_um_filter_45_9]|nr:MAG: hypothetical protein COS40_15090 [Deltaproteobacteria bacterium CG03_land_8_20_14_0_80_45_14]PIX25100.1 MAG: hypothetical protein COZ69_04375 [Deltaproteobacteria bacterium CG_4_8_14_3_um_filter_45_9]
MAAFSLKKEYLMTILFLSIVFLPVFSIYRLLPTAYCLLPSAFCFLPWDHPEIAIKLNFWYK